MLAISLTPGLSPASGGSGDSWPSGGKAKAAVERARTAADAARSIGRSLAGAGSPDEILGRQAHAAGVVPVFAAEPADIAALLPGCDRRLCCGNRSPTRAGKTEKTWVCVGGVPVFRGTRVPVQALFGYIEGGDPLKRFLDHFPSVTRDQAVAALEQAAGLLRRAASS